MNEYLNIFVAARNARASADLGELALVNSGYRIGQFRLSLLLATVHQWSLLPSGVLSSDTLRSFKSAMNLRLVRA